MSKTPTAIHVFVRQCFSSSNSTNKKRPSWYTKEAAFRNLMQTIDERVYVTVILDADSQEQATEHFVTKSGLVPVVVKKGGSDAHSFRNLLDHVFDTAAPSIQDDDIVYILEDDYVHKDGWPTVLREAFESLLADYVTLYDHPDKYDVTIYKNLQASMHATKSTHWRTTPSTTNTYAMRFKTLKRDKETHYQYSVLERGYTFDHAKFTHLSNQGKLLVSSVPGMSTHCEEGVISPFVPWGDVLSSIDKPTVASSAPPPVVCVAKRLL